MLGPSVVDRVTPDMRVYDEEIFGPVLSVVRVGDLDEALAVGDQCEYGNGAVIFTRKRLCGTGVQAAFQRGHDRDQRGCTGADGLVSVYRLEPFVLWRSAHSGDREDAVLHAPEVDAYAVAKADDSHLDPIWRQDRKIALAKLQVARKR